MRCYGCIVFLLKQLGEEKVGFKPKSALFGGLHLIERNEEIGAPDSTK
jgi:hypothetical protein